MNGIPVNIQRDGRPETIYLSTRRSGETGAAMTQAKLAYRQAKLAQARAATQLGVIIAAVDKLEERPGLSADIIRLAGEADTLTEGLNSARQAVQAAAERLIELSLRECHGEEAMAILDALADAQIEKLVAVLEAGECPADFFPSRATPPSGSITTPSAASPSAPSSKEVTRPATLKAGA